MGNYLRNKEFDESVISPPKGGTSFFYGAVVGVRVADNVRLGATDGHGIKQTDPKTCSGLFIFWTEGATFRSPTRNKLF